jgi:hypothetical protein
VDHIIASLDSLVKRAKGTHIHDDDGFKIALVLWEVGDPRFQFDPGSAGALDTIASVEEAKSRFGRNEAFPPIMSFQSKTRYRRLTQLRR